MSATVKQEHIDAIRQSAARFHEILSSLTADKILAERKQSLTTPLYGSMCSKVRSPEEMQRLAADGFEALVRLLNDLGVPDVSVHACNPEIPAGRTD
jgi:hypothetical protein